MDNGEVSEISHPSQFRKISTLCQLSRMAEKAVKSGHYRHGVTRLARPITSQYVIFVVSISDGSGDLKPYRASNILYNIFLSEFILTRHFH